MIRLSASQISTFRECPRKWSYSRPENLGPRSSESTELGTRVHTVLEAWLRDGTAPDVSTLEGRIAMPGLPHLPKPGRALVETDFKIVRSAATYTGRRDAVVASKSQPRVIDHKTTKSFQYAKTEADLRVDPQAALYAESVMGEYGTEHAELQWVYYTTKEPHRVRVVHLVMTRAETREAMRSVDDTACEIAPYVGVPPENVPRNTLSCGQFGGCRYLPECQPTPSQRIGAHMTQGSLLEKMKARNAAAPQINPPVAAAFTPPAGPAAPTESPKGGLLAAKFASRKLAETPAPALVEELPTPIVEEPPKAMPKPPSARAGRVLPSVAEPVAAPASSPSERAREAILQGLCANPAFAGSTPEAIVERLRGIEAALG